MDIIKDFHLKSVWRKQAVKQIIAMKHKKYIQDITVTQERMIKLLGSEDKRTSQRTHCMGLSFETLNSSSCGQ